MCFRSAVLLLGTILWVAVSAAVRAQITGGMLPPAFDPAGEAFSYFRHPNDVIGTLYAPVATEVTPEGYLFTGFGELMFFTGNPLEPVHKRIKTLKDGYLPIVQYEIEREGVSYVFHVFAADLGGELERHPVNYAIVQLKNKMASEPRAAFLSAAWRFSAPVNKLSALADYRFSQRFDLLPKERVAGQNVFDPAWRYAFGSNALLRNSRALYFFPSNPQPYQASLALEDNGLRTVRYFTGEVGGNPEPKYALTPHTPMGVVTYRILLDPEESRALAFKLPIAPVPQDTPEYRRIDSIDPSAQLKQTALFWQKLLGSPPLRIPERKVQEYLMANTIFDILALDRVGDDYIPNVNKFQYHRFYGGSDTAHMLVALDYMGLHEIARSAFLYSLTAQREDGAFIIPHQTSPYNYWETFGFALWGWARHYQLTRDETFLRQVYPGVVRAMAWERKITSVDPLGLMPPSEIADDAYLKDARSTGQHIWMLIGLRNAVKLAQAMGEEKDAASYGAEYERFRQAFESELAKQTAKSGGYIPPALERTLDGNDWDNLLLLYPEPLFEPFDPRVSATIRKSRSEYVEGILDFVTPRAIARDDWPAQPHGLKQAGFTFNSRRQLHYWHTPDHAQNALVRGSPEDQEQAVRDLYALLLHTTSTHAPQEFGAYPWSTRDHQGNNLLPDGPASGKTIELIRNMLVREQGNDLVLFSAVSPSWLEPGKTIEIVEEPTNFGPVSATLRATPTGLDLELSPKFRQKPERVAIRIPWFFQVDRALADGRIVRPNGNAWIVTPETRKLTIIGRIRTGTTGLSFARAVESYKQEYRRRYREFLKTGEIQP